MTSKYGNKRTTVGSRTFASKREARRYQDLLLLERAGEISDLRTQVRMPVVVNGMQVCVFVADFCYVDREGRQITEDCKGYRTQVYRLKRKLVKAALGIDILET